MLDPQPYRKLYINKVYQENFGLQTYTSKEEEAEGDEPSFISDTSQNSFVS
jgi:hypothetical protein